MTLHNNEYDYIYMGLTFSLTLLMLTTQPCTLRQFVRSILLLLSLTTPTQHYHSTSVENYSISTNPSPLTSTTHSNCASQNRSTLPPSVSSASLESRQPRNQPSKQRWCFFSSFQYLYIFSLINSNVFTVVQAVVARSET